VFNGFTSYKLTFVSGQKTIADMLTAKYTFEAWLGVKTARPYRELLECLYYNIDNSMTMFNFYQNGQFALNSAVSENNNFVKYPTNTLPIGTWVHVAICFNEGKYEFYLNGVKQCSGQLKTTSTYAFIPAIGSGASNYFILDEVMHCEEVKYTANFEPPHGPYYLPQGGE
jgi:hypothetical protein